MTLPTDADIEARLTFAVQVAHEAGKRLLALRTSGRWADQDTLGDVGDQAADGYLQGYLRGRYPDDGILSEETADSPTRQKRHFTWIVDPLDGTKEYRTGRHDWAVHVGLVMDGRPLLGAVALPAIDRVVAGVCQAGRERAQLHGSSGDWPHDLSRDRDGTEPLRIVVSRSHTPSLVQRFAAAWGPTELIPCGSVGFKVAMLLLGKADVYVHKTGLNEWDTCAPEIVARAAGWTVSRLDGTEHIYNQPDPRNDEIAVCRPNLRPRVLECLRQVR